MKKTLVAIGLALTLALTGCGAPADEPGENFEGGKTDTGYGDGHLIPDNEYYVKKIEIDGTSCVIFKDGGAGGVTCHWPQPAPLDLEP